MRAHHPDRAPAAEVGNALIARIAREDQQAMEDFYCGYQSTVYRFAAAQIPDAFAAAELLNEVMLEVWRGAARKPGSVDPLIWVLRLTHRAVQRIVPPSPPASEPPLLRLGVDGAIAEAALRRNHDLLGTCMNGLSSRLRATLHLALVEDLPVAIIAAVLGRNESDVQDCLREATTQLRYSLAQASP